MKSPFPDTPDMRWERMFLAAVTSAICLFLGLQFGSMAMQVVAQSPSSFTLSLQSSTLRFALLALPSAGFTMLGLAFFLFATVKISTLCDPSYLHAFVKARAVGMLFVLLAFAVAGLWCAANVALQFLK
ncbi:MAG: hypothetical protein ING22_10875 [Burkholderiales bacterium]|jgi:hypothetical protein|nr:hypothetical protein [Burkholderiales bacterium]